MSVDGDDSPIDPEVAAAFEKASDHARGLTSVPDADEIEQAIDDQAVPTEQTMTPDEAMLAQFYASCPPQQPMPVAVLIRPELHGGGACGCCRFPEIRPFVLFATGSPTGLTYTYIPAENVNAIADNMRESGGQAMREATLRVPMAPVPDVPGAAGATLLG